MECLQNRLDSFKKPVRVQNSSKTGASKNIKWPHSDSFLANPTSLAEAGFYYNPSYDDRDTVTCFVCEKELGGWEVEDDPFDIHYSKCAKICCWAVVRCGLKLDLDSNGRFIFSDKNRLPTSKSMEKARLQSYLVGEGWMHDKTKNHGASSKKMAKAGFVFTPQHEDDDLATCLYCGTCLSSWDSGDDPLEEHRGRRGDCPFFAGTSPPASAVATTTKGRSVSNTTRTSRSSTATTRTQTRGRSRSTMKDIIEDVTESLEPPAKPTNSRKVSRTAKKAAAPVPEEDEDESEEEEVQPKSRKSEKPRPSKKPVQRKPSKARKTVARVDEEDEDQEEEPSQTPSTAMTSDDIAPKATTSRKGSRSRKNAAPSSVEEEEEPEPIPNEKTAPLGKSTLGKSTRTKKPSRSKKPPAPSPEEDDEPEEELPPGKSTLTKKSLRSKKAIVPISADGGSASEEQTDLGKSTLSKKSSRSKKAVATPPDQDESEPEEATATLNKSTISRKSSRVKKTVAAPTSTPPTEESDNDAETARQGGRKTKVRTKSASRKIQPVPSPPSPPVERSPTDKELEELVVLKKPTKSKKSISRSASGQAEHMEEEEVKELIVPKIISKATSAQPILKTAEEQNDITDEETEEQELKEDIESRDRFAKGTADQIDPDTEEEREVQKVDPKKTRKGKAKQVDLRAGDEHASAGLPKKRTTGKLATKPAAVQDSDVEMGGVHQEALISKMDLGSAKHTKEATNPVSHYQPDVETDVEMENQADLEQIQPVIETDEPILFAPRLVMKSSSPQTRGQTPDLTPIPSFSPSRLKAEPFVSADSRFDQPSIVDSTFPARNRDPEPMHTMAPVLSLPHPTTGSSSNRGVNGAAQREPSSQPHQELPEETIPDFIPFLSKLPFVQLQSLSEAELDMTVEEWIRYQMEVEFDKFKRDGERQLSSFRQKAEEVRKVIEGL